MKYRAILLAFMMLSCMCVQAEDYKERTVTIDGVRYETYRNENGEIKVMATGIEDNYPVNVSILETVTFKVPKKDAEGNEIANEYEDYGPYEVDSLYFTFSGKEKIESVSLPNSIRTLPANMFQNCFNLKTVNLPNEIINIPHNAFTSTAITTITIPGSVTVIGESAFAGCAELQTVNIGAGVRTIGDNAFRSCTKLSKPDLTNVEIIGASAFYECCNIEKTLIIPNIKNIGANAFQNCTKLKKVIIGENIEKIGNGAFLYCPNMDNLTIYAKQRPKSGEVIENREEYYKPKPKPKPTLEVLDVDSYKESYVWLNYFNIVPLVKDAKDDKNIYRPNKENKTASLVGRLPNNTSQSAPGKMRKAAENDESITIPQTITVEGDEYTVIAIESYALCNDSQTTSFSIPATITSIDEAAFQYCENMKSFYCLASQVPQTDATAFHGTDISNATLYVPKAAVENYLNGSPWNGFGTIEGIDATGIRDVSLDIEKSETWYDLKGQVLTKKPLQKGVYIYQGKKIAIQ